MLQPDPVYELKAQNPAHSVTFLAQQLQVGRKNGGISTYCLGSMRSSTDLKASENPIQFLSSNTERLLTQEKGGIVKIWSLERSGYQLEHEIDTKYQGFAKPQHIVEQNILVAPSSTSDVSVIDLDSAKEVQVLKPPNTSVDTLTGFRAFSKDGGSSDDLYLIAGYETGHLVLYDVKKLKTLHILKFKFAVGCIDYDLGTNRGIVSGQGDYTAQTFALDKTRMEMYHRDMETLSYPGPTDGPTATISVIKFRDPDRKFIYVGMSDGTVHVHSEKFLRKLTTLRNHRGEITDFAFSKGQIDNFKSPITAVASVDGSVSLWNIYYDKH